MRKALHGLKQSPRAFNQNIEATLKSMNLTQSCADTNIYFSETGARLIVGIYVDDGLIAGSDEQLVRDFLEELGKSFEFTSKPLSCFLGLQFEISPRDGSVFIHQAKYIDELLERFQMQDCNPVATPIDNSCQSDLEAEIQPDLPYREIVGGLMYLTIATRFDISFAVGFLSRYLEKPTKPLWAVTMRVLRYLKGTRHLGLRYNSDGSGELECFSDADYAGDTQTRRSTTGQLIRFNGAALLWASTRQQSITLSSMEAELVAGSETTRSSVCISFLLKELNYELVPKLLIDNQAVIKLVHNPQSHKRSKHIEVRHYYIREKFQRGLIDIQHVPSAEQLADIFTKPLVKPIFVNLRMLAGISE